MKLRLSGIEKESIVDGPGIRAVIFAQGCPFRCPGCHNPDTWDYCGGKEFDVDEVFSMINTCFLDGITFSGGEPFSQPTAFVELGKKFKEKGMSIVVYTGYTFEELLKSNEPGWKKLLSITDILIDGPYQQNKKDLSLAFRGSSNQRIINIPDSFKKGKAVLLKN